MLPTCTGPGVSSSVTRDALDRALGLIDALLKALVLQGFDVAVDSDRGVSQLRSRETGTVLEFALTEYVRRSRHEITSAEERARKRYYERSHWDHSTSFPHVPMYDYTPTGILTIQVGCWPSRSWKDTPRTQLEQRLGEVVAGVSALAQETHTRELEEARRQAEHRQAIARYEFLVKRREDESGRFKRLEEEATDWERSARIRKYADAVEERANAVGEISAEQLDWLKWVRAKADWLDPLVPISDMILDAPEPMAPSYW